MKKKKKKIGTGALVNIPKRLEAHAAQFKSNVSKKVLIDENGYFLMQVPT